MKPKFAAGTKVRIKSQDALGRILSPDIRQYENLKGEIIEATNIIAFIGKSEVNPQDSSGTITIYHYTVRIDDQTTLQDVYEEYLEISS